jgi:hypothetical protein
MGLSAADFTGAVKLSALKYYHSGMAETAINTIVGNLGAAVTADSANLYDCTLKEPGGTLSPSSWPDNLTRELELLINKGRNSLGPTQMGSILTSLVGQTLPPANTVAPVASGTLVHPSTLTVTNGTWDNNPSTYTYQWLRAGAPIFNATATTYVTAAADVSFLISCRVTAYNGNGNGQATSNSLGPIT